MIAHIIFEEIYQFHDEAKCVFQMELKVHRKRINTEEKVKVVPSLFSSVFILQSSSMR